MHASPVLLWWFKAKRDDGGEQRHDLGHLQGHRQLPPFTAEKRRGRCPTSGQAPVRMDLTPWI